MTTTPGPRTEAGRFMAGFVRALGVAWKFDINANELDKAILAIEAEVEEKMLAGFDAIAIEAEQTWERGYDRGFNVAKLTARADVDGLAPEALARIAAFGDFEEGWDSYGGRPISIRARDVATILVKALTAHGMPTPFPVPTASGGISLEWNPDDLCVTVEPDGRTCVWADPMEDCEPRRADVDGLVALRKYGEHQHEPVPFPTKRFENGAWRDAVEPEEGWDRIGAGRMCPEDGVCWCGLDALIAGDKAEAPLNPCGVCGAERDDMRHALASTVVHPSTAHAFWDTRAGDKAEAPTHE